MERSEGCSETDHSGLTDGTVPPAQIIKCSRQRNHCVSKKVSENKDAGNSNWLSVLEVKYKLMEEKEAGDKGNVELHPIRKR